MPVKKKSKQWRKNKIEDVEEALEDDRLVQKLKSKTLLGKSEMKEREKEADELSGLFTVDTKGSFEGLSKTSRRAAARAKLFPPKKANIGLSAFEECKVAAAENTLEVKKGQKPKPKENAMFDLWSMPVPAKVAAEQAKATASNVRTSALKTPVSAPGTLGKKVSAAPAVLPAHEGQSMNPETGALEDLTFAAAAKQLEQEREEEAQDRKMRPITAVLEDEFGKEKVREMDEEARVTAYREIVCASGDAEGAEGDAGSYLQGSKKNKKKAQAVRNREKRRKTIDEEERRGQAQKKMEKSVGEIGNMLKEMKEKEAWLAERKKYRGTVKRKRDEVEATEGVVPKHRRLGKTKFQEEALVIPNAEAATKGLRAMPLSGTTAVKDRVESIMRRGLLPAPPEASTRETKFRRKADRMLSKRRKHISPLLRDGIMHSKN